MVIINIEKLNYSYGKKEVLKELSLDIGSVNIIKDKNILDYWEDESIPSGVCFTGTLYYNLSLEKIEIIKDKKLINIIGDGVNLKLTSKNKIKVEILVTKEHFFFTRASFKEMCTMTFIIDNDKKYKWGFRISEKKAEEIKKILEDIEVEFNE